MADKEITVKFNTDADTSGAKNAKEAVEEVTEVTQQQIEATKKLSAAEDAREKRISEQEKRKANQAPLNNFRGVGYDYPGMPGLTGQVFTEETLASADALDKKADAAKNASAAVNKLSNAEEEELAVARKQLETSKELFEAHKVATEKAASSNSSGTGLNTELASGNTSTAAAAAGAAAVASVGKASLQAITESLIRYQELKKEMGDTTEINAWGQAILKTVEMLSSPIETIKNGLKSIAGLDGLEESTKRAGEYKAALEKLIDTEKKRRSEADNTAFETALQHQRQEIDNQTAAYQRQIEVLQSRKTLLNAKASAQEAAQLASGADPSLVAAQRIERELEARKAELNAQIEQIQQQIQTAKDEQTVATNQLNDAINNNKGVEAINQARENEEAAGNKVSELVADLKAQQEINQNEAQAAVVNATTAIQGEAGKMKERITDLGTAAGQKLKEGAQELLAASTKNQAEIVASGKQVTKDQQAYHELLKKLISDTTPDEKQVNEIVRLMNGLSSTIQSKDNAILESMTKSLSIVKATAQEISALGQKLRNAEQDIQYLLKNAVIK